MNALQQNSFNKDKKTKKLLVTSVSVAVLAVGLSFPIGSAILSNAQNGNSQMGGAPGAPAPATPEEQQKFDAQAVVKKVYDFRPTGTGQSALDQTAAMVKENSSEEFYAHYMNERAAATYNPLTFTQQYADSATYGPSYLNGDTVYVAADLLKGTGENRSKYIDLVVTVDAKTSKITGVAAEYKKYE